MSGFLQAFGVRLPIIQAPMAGVSTPAMVAAVANAGALGSLGLGPLDPGTAAQMIAAVRAATDRPFNVNLFCHQEPERDPMREAAWVSHLGPHFARFGASPPAELRETYRSFAVDRQMQAVILAARPPVVSFHFGLPPESTLAALRAAGCRLIASATSTAEARVLEAAGLDAIIAQGFEAGGHRGIFDPSGDDDKLSAAALTGLLVREIARPIISAGGIMNGAGVRAMLDLGASAAQLGTAFIACSESSADAGYRAALSSDAAHHTQFTAAITGRPARCIPNALTALGQNGPAIPAYPITYDAGKALIAAAKARGDDSYGAYWAGQGAPLARTLSAAALVAELDRELQNTR